MRPTCSMFLLVTIVILYDVPGESVPQMSLVPVVNCAPFFPCSCWDSAARGTPVLAGNCTHCISCSGWELCPVYFLFLLGTVPVLSVFLLFLIGAVPSVYLFLLGIVHSVPPVPSRNCAQYVYCTCRELFPVHLLFLLDNMPNISSVPDRKWALCISCW
jgi:hypothetical protein